MKSGSIGMLLVFCLVAFAIVLGDDGAFLNVPSLVICIGLPIGLSMASSSAADTAAALRSLRCLLISPRAADVTIRNSQVLRHMVSYSYAAGIMGAMIGWIQLLRRVEETPNVYCGFSLSLLTMFYSVIISECVLRPAARQIESGRFEGELGEATAQH